VGMRNKAKALEEVRDPPPPPRALYPTSFPTHLFAPTFETYTARLLYGASSLSSPCEMTLSMLPCYNRFKIYLFVFFATRRSGGGAKRTRPCCWRSGGRSSGGCRYVLFLLVNKSDINLSVTGIKELRKRRKELGRLQVRSLPYS
jgi:hypothetical protein